jgi:hypothetical protein
VRRHAKASSAAPNLDRADSLGSVRRAFATRGCSGDADGSGAPSSRARIGVIGLLLALVSLLAFAPFSQARFVVGGYGGLKDDHGGEFGSSSPEGFGSAGEVAVNSTGAGGVPQGTFYVIHNTGGAARIQRFSPSGDFELTWGGNVMGRNERQFLEIQNGEKVGSASGSFTLSVGGDTTGPICFCGPFTPKSLTPTASEIQGALQALPSVGAGNVQVAGNTATGYTVVFAGALTGTNVAQMTSDVSNLESDTPGLPLSVPVSTLENGTGGTFSGFEICTTAVLCKGPERTLTANGGQLASSDGVGINQTSGHVYVSEGDNQRISEFDADGNFVRAWGWDVIASGQPNDNGTGFEICDATAGNALTDCKRGASGAGAGQFAGITGRPTIDASGNVWVPDRFNNRIQAFDSTGHFIKMAGGDVITNGATGTGTLTSGSKTVSSLVTTSHYFEVGQTVTSSGGHIPPGTTVTAVTSTSLTLSQNATESGSETITAAAGAGNVPTNEVQTISVDDDVLAGKFRLHFDGKSTGTVGTGDWGDAPNTNVITNVKTTTGAFAVGQGITAFLAIPRGTTITAVDTVNHTLTLSKPITNNGSVGTNVQIIGHNISAVDAPAAVVQAELESLPNIALGDVSVNGPDGGPWTVEFEGRYADTDVPELSFENWNLVTDPNNFFTSIDFTSVNGFEVCSIPADCRRGARGTAPGQFGNFESPGDLAFDSTGNLYALDASGNRVQRFDPTLSSIVNFGAAGFAPYTTEAPEQMTAIQGGSRLLFGVNNNLSGPPGQGERLILELDTGGSVKDTSLVGAGLTSDLGGLANDEASGTAYVTAGFLSNSNSPRPILALGSTPPPDLAVVIDPVTTNTDTTATFTGTVNPNGGLASCEFQYSTDQVDWTDVPEPACDSFAPSGGAQPVSESVTGLDPNTHYYVRLATLRPLLAGSDKLAEVEFDTDATPPVVSKVGVVGIADTSARLVGTIDPRHSDTEYTFEYGTTPALGSATSPVNIGDGTVPVIVSLVVEGLSPDTTYHFRLVATNSSGPTASPVDTFTTRAEPLPPSERAYEQVTPAAKLDNVYIPNGVAPGSFRKPASDGETFSFCGQASLGDPPPQFSNGCTGYTSVRGPAGWAMRSHMPLACQVNHEDVSDLGVLFTAGASDDGRSVVLTRPESDSCALPPLDPAAPVPGHNLYRLDVTAPSPSYELLTPEQANPPSFTTFNGEFRGGNDDFSHVIYSSRAQQSEDAPAGNFEKLFDWHDGTVDLISKNPSGAAFTTSSNLAYKGVSADGSRIFFHNPSSADCRPVCKSVQPKLYLRDGGAATYEVSQSECTSACGPAGYELFQKATPDGSRAWFISREKLTDDDTLSAGLDLYLYTHSANPGADENLTLISRDLEPADGTRAMVERLLSASADGNTAFFVARGQVIPGGSTAPGYKIYRWRWNSGSPSVDHLFSLPIINDNDPVKQELGFFDYPFSELTTLTPDGKYLLLRLKAALDPVQDHDADFDIYRWSEEEGFVCISCQVPGVPSNSDAQISDGGRTMTEDGQRIFFITEDSLVGADTNGEVQDVYEWHDGALSLVSSGFGKGRSYLVGTTGSGRDVFFITYDKLVGWDGDAYNDIYDARIGGGFPEPPVTGAPCEGEACRTASTIPPLSAGAGTAAFEGPGNPRTRPDCRKGQVRRKGRCVGRKHRKHKKRNRQRAAADRRASR